MAFIKSEEKSKNQYVIEFSIEKETFDAEVTKIFREKSRNITVPGFRRGKAPRPVIEKMYGKGVFYEDALNNLIPAAYAEAEKASGLEIVSRPEFDLDEIGESGVRVLATVWVRPELTIKGYKGIEVERHYHPVTEEEINDRIKGVRERNSRTEDVTGRPAEAADIANIDYEGFCDGKAFEGGKGVSQDLVLGSGTFIPGFEEQIVGKEVGAEFDVNVTFPEEYHAKELAGKPAVFKCKLNALKRKILPELDDEFAKDVSDFDTYAEYLADVKAKITEEHEKHAESHLEESLADALASKLEGDIPACMFDAEAENIVRDYEMSLRRSGLSLDDYMKYTGKDLAGLKAEMMPRAEKSVRTRLALETIAEAEKLEATDEQIDAELKKIADAYGIDADKIGEYVPRENVKRDVLAESAMKLVRDSAKITEEAEGEKPAKAKKAPAKKADPEKKPAAAKKPAAKKAPVKKEAAAEKAEKPAKTTKKKAEPKETK
ncbi:MAG: trigger factor [Clostridia bacterium]|nr:trigger factor [Clostridia bacterium]